MSAADTAIRLRWAGLCLAALSCGAALAQSPCRVLTPTLQQSYQGECLNGLAHGQGAAQGSDRYQGQFQQGQPHGQGVYQFQDGRRFEGQFIAGRISGTARFYYANGDLLEGEFRDNKLSGVGRLQRVGQAPMSVSLAADGRLQAATGGGNPSPVTPASPTPGVVAGGAWQATLDFQDLFPSYLFATATRAQPKAAASRSVADTARSRGPFIPPLEPPAGPAKSRHISAHANVTYLGDAWGLVGVRYTAQQPGQRVRLRIEAEELTEPTETEFELGAPGEYALYPKLRYRYERLKENQQPRPVHLRWQLWVNGQSLGVQERTAQLRAIQDAPFRLDGVRGREIMGWVFAAFVTEEAPWIDAFLKEAFATYRSGPIGYQGDAKDVDWQVSVIYEALKKRGVKYSSITAKAGSVDHVGSQTVRMPSQSIRVSQANCVDGTVLVASILRRIGIESYIVIGPGHAMVGYLRAPEPILKNFMVLETVLIGQEPFEKAIAAGQAQFAEWRELKNDPRFQIISVSDERKNGVMPIPL